MSSCASMMTSMELRNAKTKAAEHKYTEALNLAVSALDYSDGTSTEAANLIVDTVYLGDMYYNNLINQYRQQNQDASYEKIYSAYENLTKMYDFVAQKNLENFTVGGMVYSVVMKDYTTELNTARDEAGSVYYAMAVKEMNKDTVTGYRLAYRDLQFIQSMYTNTYCPFKDIDSRLEKAQREGTIDIYIITPSSVDMSVTSETMEDTLEQLLYKNTDWVKFHFGPQIDMAYQASTINDGPQYLMSLKGQTVDTSKKIRAFGKEVGADIVIYTNFDNLQSNKIKTTNHKDKFTGKSNGNEDYIMNLNWSKYSKKTSLTCNCFVADVQTGKTLLNIKNKKISQNILYYTGKYTIPSDIWSIETHVNFAELLSINNIEDYKYINNGFNGWAYRTNYASDALELRDKTTFDEDLVKFKNNAETEAKYKTLLLIKNRISEAISDYT